MNGCCKMKLPILFLLTLMVGFGTNVLSDLDSKGSIRPSDPLVERGQPLRFNCSLNCENLPSDVRCNASDIFLKTNSEKILVREDGNIKLTILNPTTLEYFNPRIQQKDGGYYHCYLAKKDTQIEEQIGEHIDATAVHVAPPLVLPDKLDCRSPNWESLKCSWNCSMYDKYGPTRVHWNVTYTLDDFIWPNKSSIAKLARHGTQCPNPIFTSHQCSCIWSKKVFMPSVYHVYLIATNAIRMKEAEFRFDTADIVAPGPVVDFRVFEVTETSLTLRWKNPKNLGPNLLPLLYEAVVSSEYGDLKPIQWNISCSICSTVIRGLVPYTGYSVRIRSTPQVNGRFWSNYSYTSAWTDADVPGQNPTATVGAFRWEAIHDTNQTRAHNVAHIYYKDIPKRYAHGAIMSTSASYFYGKHNTQCNVDKRECTIAKLDPSQNHDILIKSTTVAGAGPKTPTSIFHIASFEKAPPVPEDFNGELLNVTAESFTSILFTWSSTTMPQDVSYTLFYRHCQAGVCKGGLQWVIIGKNTNQYILRISHVNLSISDYSFAIAASIDGASRGMTEWVNCLYDFSKGPSKAPELTIMDQEVQEEKSLKVQWETVPCSKGSGRILHYSISVRELSNEQESGGSASSDKVYIVPAYEKMFQVPDLKLATQYGITLTAVGRTESRRSPQIRGQTLEAPERTIPVAVIGICVTIAVVVVGGIIFAMYRYYRKVLDNPVHINVPMGHGIIASFDYHRDEEAEEYLHIENESEANSDSDGPPSDNENNPILGQGKKTLDTQRQLSRDSGTGSMMSNTTKESLNASEAGTDSVNDSINNSLEAVSEEGEEQYNDSGGSKKSKQNAGNDLVVTQMPTSQGYCVVGLVSPGNDVLSDIQAYGPGPPRNNVYTVGCVQYGSPPLSKSLATSDESMEFKPVHSSSRGTSSNSLDTLTTPSPLPVIQNLQRNYLPDLGYGTDDSSGKARIKALGKMDKKQAAEQQKRKEDALKKNKDFSSLGSVCSSSSFEESYSKLAVRNMSQDQIGVNNNVNDDNKNILKLDSVKNICEIDRPAVLPVDVVTLGNNNSGNGSKGTDQKKAFDDSCGNSLADTNSDSNISVASLPKTSPPLMRMKSGVDVKSCLMPDSQKVTGSYVSRPESLFSKDANGCVVNLTNPLNGDVSEDDTCSDSISPYSKFGVSPDVMDVNPCGIQPSSDYLPNDITKGMPPVVGKNGYVDLPVVNEFPFPGQRTSYEDDDESDSSSQSDFSVEDCTIDVKALGLTTGGIAVLPVDDGVTKTDDFSKHSTKCNGHINTFTDDKPVCV